MVKPKSLEKNWITTGEELDNYAQSIGWFDAEPSEYTGHAKRILSEHTTVQLRGSMDKWNASNVRFKFPDGNFRCVGANHQLRWE